MAISVKKLPDEPIIIYEYGESITTQDVHTAIMEAGTICEALEGEVHLIHDASRLTIDFSRTVQVLVTLSRDIHPVFEDKKRFAYHVVGAQGLIKMAAKALTQNQYGSFPVRYAGDTLDEALTVVRAVLRPQTEAASARSQ